MKDQRQITLRITQTNFQALKELQEKAGTSETQAFILCSKAQGPNEEIYLANKILFPEDGDLERQSLASVVPTAQFQAVAYGLAHDSRHSIIDFHTHPFADEVVLSSIDFHHGEKNARYITEHFPKGSTMGMIVFGRSMQSFDGRVWHKQKGEFQTIDQLQILGSPIQILPKLSPEPFQDDMYSRHQLIPDWDQRRLSQLKVFIAGLGGNGSQMLSALLSLGVGSNGGWIRACDPDVIETSNLPRIPYAIPQDAGRHKAEIAQIYAIRKAPGTSVRCYAKSIQDPEMAEMAKEAHVIIGAVDSEGARKLLNSIAARYLIPYLDVATEIIPGDSSCDYLGQVHVFVPGAGGCLMCAGLIDLNEAALDLLTDQQKQERAKVGYVRGTNQTPTPSVLHLNGVTSYLAVSQLMRLVFGLDINSSAFLHYSLHDFQLLPAVALADEKCPVCGIEGYLGEGDQGTPEIADTSLETPKTFELSKGQIRPDRENVAEAVSTTPKHNQFEKKETKFQC